MTLVLAAGISIAIPLVFLWLVRRLDLYASGTFDAIIVCFSWGVLSFIAAYLIHREALPWVGRGLLVVVVAPIIEELLKSLVLVYHVRRPDFTYFVDGAIYGFAVGTAFAILETPYYLVTRGGGLEMALLRSFSTSLMHGSASALVGVALGRLRFGHGPTRVASLLLGWAGAIALHMAFNHVVNGPRGLLVLVMGVAIGLSGVALTVMFILWGLREERSWLRDTLGLGVGVSVGESAMVQRIENFDTLLAPIAERFGEEKREQVEEFLRLQARLGLKRKTQELTPDPKLRAQLALQVDELRDRVDVLRRAVGVYCMSYVRSILPPETEPFWSRLEQSLIEKQATPSSPTGLNLWSNLGDKMQ